MFYYSTHYSYPDCLRDLIGVTRNITVTSGDLRSVSLDDARGRLSTCGDIIGGAAACRSTDYTSFLGDIFVPLQKYMLKNHDRCPQGHNC